MLSIRLLKSSDIPFAMRLVEAAGWNQLPGDWERLIRVEPEGCFLAEWDGEPAGTATTIAYGTDCAWIGMVLVAPAFRRLGIGSGLIAHCLGYLKGLGVRAIKLDATDDGRPVYAKQGFADEYGVVRHVGRFEMADMSASGVTLRPLAESYWPVIASLDRVAFGCDRQGLLRDLVGRRADLAVVAVRGGRVVGFGMVRPGRLCGYIGPVVAAETVVAQAIVTGLEDRLGTAEVMVDTTALNPGWCEWLTACGLQPRRRLTRMVLGTNEAPGQPAMCYGLSGFETG